MSNTLQVGQTYTSENGNKWECIFIRGDKAWLIGVFDGTAEGSAYQFDTDGTASWAGGNESDGYNIKWGPKRETTNFALKHESGDFASYATLTYDLIDGTPDWTTAKVTPCD